MLSSKFIMKRRELFVYIAVFLYCTALFFKRTSIPIDQNILNKIMTISAVISLGNVIFDLEMSLKQWLITVMLGGFLFIDSIPTGNHELLYLFILIWSCRNVDKNKLMRYIYTIIIVLTLFIALFTGIGLIENERFVQNGVRVRYGLGYNVWSILPFQFYSICMYYMYFSKKVVRLDKIIFMSLCSVWIGIVTDTKTSIVITIVGLCTMYIVQSKKIINWKQLKILVLLPEVIAACSLFMTLGYINGNVLFQKLNILMNYRLMYQSIGLEKYGVSIFANGNYRVSAESGNYFGIDNQYMNLAIAWGISALIIVLIIYSHLIRYCLINKNIKLLIIVIIMVFMGIMWSRMLVLVEAAYLICFSDLFANANSTKQKLKCRREKISE